MVKANRFIDGQVEWRGNRETVSSSPVDHKHSTKVRKPQQDTKSKGMALQRWRREMEMAIKIDKETYCTDVDKSFTGEQK